MVRKLTFVFAVFAALVVAMGYVPQFITAQQGDERMMFGLYKISLLDDVTHGLTAIAALAAFAHSRKACVLFLTAFGWYYALDAIFYLTYGVLSGQALGANIGLNSPHVIVSGVMLWLVYRWVPREDQSGSLRSQASTGKAYA
jgi:hypothetical protein